MLSLEIGRTYFRLTYADPGMTMPGVEPLVYIGDSDPEDEGMAHIFQDTVSYSRFGSRLNQASDNEEIVCFFVPPAEVGSGILDVQQISAAVSAAAERATVLNNPVLTIVRDGWFDVP